MEPKKHPRADLERWRSIFFLAGLLLVLLAVVGIIQIKRQVSQPQVLQSAETTRESVVIPITKTEVKEEVKPKKLTKKPPEVSNVFKPVEKLPIDQPGETFEPPEEPPVEVAYGGKTEEPEPVPPMLLENMALPASCAGEDSKEAKMSCINAWMNKYIQQHIKYPPNARKMRLEDKVILTFVINTDGAITEVQTLRGQYDLLNEEAMRVVRGMPAWNPARQFTRKVKMRMTVPVHFKLP